MIWPFVPRVPIVERLSWLTDVMQTREGERRVSLRPARLELQYSYMFDEAQDARAVALFRSNPLGDWDVPQWSEYTQFASPVAAGATSLPVNTSADYRVGGFVYVSAGDDEGEAIEIASVGSGTIGLDAATTVAAVGAAPIRSAYMLEGMGGARRFKGLTDRAVSFVTRDGIDLAATDFPQLDGIDVVTDPTLTVSPLQDLYFQAKEFVDNGSGPVAVEPRRDIIEGRVEIEFLDLTPESRYRRKQWFHSIRGREGAFWVPSWSRDFTLANPIGSSDTSFDVVALDGDPADYVGRAVMIDDGSPLFRIITAAQDLSGTWRFTIASTGRAISAARISRLLKYRLDTDEVEFSQLKEVYANIRVTCLEVPA